LPSHVLILAYGNPLRGDDGVAWRAADLLRGRLSPKRVDILCSHQLLPEFAELAADADGVLFIDAAEAGEPGHIVWQEVDPGADSSHNSHSLTPAQLLTLGESLYGARPPAIAISIAAASFQHGETLSPAVQRALPELVAMAEDLVARLARSPSGVGQM
jgi:hydrogenase maturation protease